MDRPLFSLHLFAGAGGGLLADLLVGVRPVCAVEIEKYPQRVLKHRFPGLPVWDDVCTFRADNPDCAECFAWMREHRAALVVAGGFPCQDISAAGLGKGLEGERSGLWREFARIVREIRPGFVFVENSPMLVHRGLERVLGDLAACGYDAVWRVLAASDVGARHERERIWIAAALRDNDHAGGGIPKRVAQREQEPDTDTGGTVPHPLRSGTAALFPTPSRRDYRHGSDHPHGFGQRNLNDIALQYPTPRAHDRLPGGGRI